MPKALNLPVAALELKIDGGKLLDRIPGRVIQARASGEAVGEDDNEEALAVRLTAYANQTQRLTHYYAAKGLLRTIDASQQIEQVTAAMVEAIDCLARLQLRLQSLD